MKSLLLAIRALAVAALMIPSTLLAQSTVTPLPADEPTTPDSSAVVAPLTTTTAPISPTLDSDNDGLFDVWETAIGTDAMIADTDGDGFSDGLEVNTGYDPLSSSAKKIDKRIIVTLKTQTLAYYFGPTKLDEFSISGGLPRTPTPKGNYKVLAKKPLVWYAGPGYDYPNTKWNLMFKPGKTGNYYIHGAYWHNKFGTPRSHGCVNVSYSNVERLYNWAEVGTPILVE